MMSSREDRNLQRYYDGELSRREARRVHERLEADPADRQRLAALERMHDLLAASAEGAATEADFSQLWGRVSRGVAEQKEEPAWGPARKLFGWIALGVSATAAVTVALLIWLAVPPPSNDCVIESLEVGPSAVSTIFTIADPDTLGETTVIWVSDREAEGSL